jgi:hypothetical protein
MEKGDGWLARSSEGGDRIPPLAVSRKKEKRGVPRHHGNMLPGNSFPQICVVSGNIFVEKGTSTQEYLRVVALSNRHVN